MPENYAKKGFWLCKYPGSTVHMISRDQNVFDVQTFDQPILDTLYKKPENIIILIRNWTLLYQTK